LPFQDFAGLLWDDKSNHFKMTSQNGTFVSVNGTTWTRLSSNNDGIVLHSLKLYGNKLVGTGYVNHDKISFFGIITVSLFFGLKLHNYLA
jgi:hypothetical protein